VVGLVDAIVNFDANKQVKLEIYAQHRIREAILDGPLLYGRAGLLDEVALLSPWGFQCMGVLR